MNRKSFITQCTVASGALMLAPASLYAQGDPLPASLPAEKVKDFVVAGHGNIDKVKQLLSETPALLFAAWDWGGGDFETALEGAGHVGNKEIASFLIEQGARTNLFVLTMLGKTSIVKPFLEQFPSYVFAKGPHGLSLLHHAQKGGAAAKELADYLQSKGLKETKFKI